MKTNGLIMDCAYIMVRLGYSLEDVVKKTQDISTIDFERKTSEWLGPAGAKYHLKWTDYVQSIVSASKLGWFDFNTFDSKQASHYMTFVNGDMSWIVPKYVLAFSSPADDNKSRLV